jgi:hypothetical protein
MIWDEAVAYALTIEGTELTTSYRQPAVKANGNGVLNVGHESDVSFCLHLDLDLKQMLMDTHPETFFETPHYAGYPALLVRYDAPDDAIVREMIARSVERAKAKKPPRPRKA